MRVREWNASRVQISNVKLEYIFRFSGIFLLHLNIIAPSSELGSRGNPVTIQIIHFTSVAAINLVAAGCWRCRATCQAEGAVPLDGGRGGLTCIKLMCPSRIQIQNHCSCEDASQRPARTMLGGGGVRFRADGA